MSRAALDELEASGVSLLLYLLSLVYNQHLGLFMAEIQLSVPDLRLNKPAWDPLGWPRLSGRSRWASGLRLVWIRSGLSSSLGREELWRIYLHMRRKQEALKSWEVLVYCWAPWWCWWLQEKKEKNNLLTNGTKKQKRWSSMGDVYLQAVSEHCKVSSV